MATSLTVSSRLQGRKSTAPMLTLRPSSSLSRDCACDLSSGGTASQASAHSASSTASAIAGGAARRPGDSSPQPAGGGGDESLRSEAGRGHAKGPAS